VDRRTVDIYEEHAGTWTRRRGPVAIDEARAYAALVGAGPVVDLGCGPGWYAAVLPEPAVALDAARAMLDRVAEHAPRALRVRADLTALPFRPRVLRGAWARNSYVHVPLDAVPMALADLHRALHPDAVVRLIFFGGDGEGRELFDADEFPGRFFSLWNRDQLHDVLVGAGFALERFDVRAHEKGSDINVLARRGRTLPDTVGPGMRLLVCGLNPSLYAADAGVGYARPNNRFWVAARAAGLVERDRDPGHALRIHGIGMTDIVKRATVAAAELTDAEYRDGFARVERLVAWLRPRSICFVGLAGWRAAVDRRAVPGVQDRALAGAPVYLMPSTSGLNAHARPDQLADHLRAAAGLGDVRPR
jgi:TDG/mug DNA glycosylase family protein